MLKVLNHIVFLILLSLSSTSIGQNIAFERSIGLALHPGFLYAHTEDARNLQAHTMGFELQMTKLNIKNRVWANGYKRPKVGMNLLYMNLGQKDLTGNAFAIVPNFETALKVKTNADFSIRLGTGLCYLTQKFERYDNRRNLSIGTHTNGTLQLLFLYNHYSPKSRFTAGFGLTHFSNASARVPNLGVNMPSLYIASHFNYKKADRLPYIKDTSANLPYEAYFALALNERSLANPHEFVVGNAAFLKFKQLTAVRSWHWGGDMFFDKTHHFMEYPDLPLTHLKPWEMIELGVRAGYVWRISKIDLSTDVGIYLYKPSKNKAFTYQLIGLKYNLTDHIYLQSNLKIHFGTADFFNWGIGYKWGKKA